ncbi:MAG: 1-deoxy-D-xylulose-5-phosphate reductoisomerase, partial [Proteobacteria bacterium]|nr:1-deoxy-D-xylulose-5-phosphate reductoisomerase [Pseudomonadota bacterium]
KKRIALANKESIVVFGDLIPKEQYKYIMPVDSEHNAIYQCLSGEKHDSIRKIILTASGGPFFKRENLEGIKVDEALNHPTWSMGKKITVDSATMINKGYEIIEAHHLFDMPVNNIEVLIHPQSIIHSLVEFKDNSVKAILSQPDMKLPIEYALFEGKRGDSVIRELKLEEIGHLDFYKPDETVFKGLSIARECAKTGGTMPAVLNAADEAAVKRFLKGEIEFSDIIKIIEKTINAHTTINNPSINDIIEANNRAYKFAEGVIL